MTVGARLGAKVRGRFSRRGPGDDQVSILPGEEEEEAAAAGAGGSAGAPLAAALQEEEEGAGCRKVRFAVLPGSYEPLRPPRAPGKRPYGKRLKKYGKEVTSPTVWWFGFLPTGRRVPLVTKLLCGTILLFFSCSCPLSTSQNVGKVLQKGCHYLVVGLQGLAAAYSAPFGVSAHVASFVR